MRVPCTMNLFNIKQLLNDRRQEDNATVQPTGDVLTYT